MDDTLIAEDFLLLLLDDESGKLQGTSFLGTGLGGALLIELSLRGAVELTEKQTFRQPKVVAADDAPSLPPRRWSPASAGNAKPCCKAVRDAVMASQVAVIAAVSAAAAASSS